MQIGVCIITLVFFVPIGSFSHFLVKPIRPNLSSAKWHSWSCAHCCTPPECVIMFSNFQILLLDLPWLQSGWCHQQNPCSLCIHFCILFLLDQHCRLICHGRQWAPFVHAFWDDLWHCMVVIVVDGYDMVFDFSSLVFPCISYFVPVYIEQC